jgi:hypothetical protein
MKILTFGIGDIAFIHMGGKGNPLRKSKVIHSFKHGYQTLYVMEIPTSIDSLYEVRSGEAMSDTPEGPIGMWRR